MPNNCYNFIIISGPKDQLEGVVEVIQSTNAEAFGLKNLFPCPEELYNHSHSEWITPPAIWQTWVDDGTMTQGDYDNHLKNIELGKIKSQENIEKYGYPDWYRWCLDNWGNKWGDYDHINHNLLIEEDHDSNGSHGEVAFSYYTAWGPFETSFWEKVSSDYPDLTFTVEFEESGMGFQGVSIATKEICVMEVEDIGFEWGDDPDDSDYENYQQHVDDKHGIMLQSVLGKIQDILSKYP